LLPWFGEPRRSLASVFDSLTSFKVLGKAAGFRVTGGFAASGAALAFFVFLERNKPVQSAEVESIWLGRAATRQGDHERDSGLNAELVVDRMQMRFHGTFVHTQFLSDHSIGKSIAG
jgi:hypothetical protein